MLLYRVALPSTSTVYLALQLVLHTGAVRFISGREHIRDYSPLYQYSSATVDGATGTGEVICVLLLASLIFTKLHPSSSTVHSIYTVDYNTRGYKDTVYIVLVLPDYCTGLFTRL